MDDAPAVDGGQQHSNVKAEQDSEGSEDVGDKPEAKVETGAVEDLKVVVSIKGAEPPSVCSAPRRTRT